NQARTSLKQNRHRFTDAELEQYGLKEELPKADHRNLFQKAAGAVEHKGLSLVGVGTSLRGRAGQTSAKTLKAIGEPLADVPHGLSHGEGVGKTMQIAGQDARDDFRKAARAPF